MCVEDYYMDPSKTWKNNETLGAPPPDGKCVACLSVVDGAIEDIPGVLCTESGNTLAHLEMQEGHYRFDPESTEAYWCTYPNNCVGGNGTGDALCYEGAGGALW